MKAERKNQKKSLKTTKVLHVQSKKTQQKIANSTQDHPQPGVKLTLGSKWMEKEIEIKSLSENKDDLIQQVTNLKESIQFTNQELQILQRQNTQLKQSIKQTKQTTISQSHEIYNLTSQNKNQQSQLRTKSQKIQELQDTIEHLQKSYDELEFLHKQSENFKRNYKQECKNLELLQDKTLKQNLKLKDECSKHIRHIEAISKNLVNKEKHIGLLVNEKDKLLNKMDVLQNLKSQKVKNVKFEKNFKAASKEMFIPSKQKGSLFPQQQSSSSLKCITNKESSSFLIKKMQSEISVKEERIEQLEKENYNLLNRMRNLKLK